MSTPQAYIVDAIRTPVGKRKGSLANVHPADLGAHVISSIVERTGIDPNVVDDVAVSYTHLTLPTSDLV